MKPGDRKPHSLGFLTVLDSDQHGLFGGYLILNVAGRPLEFHCTAPVKPNRAQQILYGPTLIPYLYGEQIGQALVQKAAAQPGVVCTDLPPVLTVREHVQIPVLLILPPDVVTEDDTFTWGSNRMTVRRGNAQDRELAAQFLASLPDVLDLSEPFGRIRAAIDEAQRSGRPSQAA